MRLIIDKLSLNLVRVVSILVTFVISIRYMIKYKKDKTVKKNKVISLVSGIFSGILLLSEIDDDFHPVMEEVDEDNNDNNDD